MIAGLRGTVEGRRNDSLLVSVGGVVFQVYVPLRLLDQVGEPGRPVYLHTHLHLREDGATLFGFASPAEVELFRLLQTVTGVGPRLALAVLSAYPPDQVAQFIAREDVASLSAVPGVGRRTASRITHELKGRLASIALGDGVALVGVRAQALAALQALGYGATEAQAALRALQPEDEADVETALRACLAWLGQRLG